MTERCLELVKQCEGFYPEPYVCPAGYVTIGYGHILPKGGTSISYPLSEEQAEELLIKDLTSTEVAIKPLIRVDIHDWMLDSLISFSFNVGIYAFRASTLRRLLNQRCFYEAADQFPRWVYARGKKLPGLVRRRLLEKELFLEGVEQLSLGGTA